MAIFTIMHNAQVRATEDRNLIDADLKARRAKRKAEGRSATPEEQEEERIMKRFRPLTADEAVTRTRNRMAEMDHENGITVGGPSFSPTLQPRMHPDRWRRADPEDMKAYDEAFAKRQRAQEERREWEYNRPEAVQARKERAIYEGILKGLKAKHPKRKSKSK